MPAIHPYLDSVLSPEQRADDLLSHMSLEDKAGQLFHSQIGMGPGATLADADTAFGLPSTETLGRQVPGTAGTVNNLSRPMPLGDAHFLPVALLVRVRARHALAGGDEAP